MSSSTLLAAMNVSRDLFAAAIADFASFVSRLLLHISHNKKKSMINTIYTYILRTSKNWPINEQRNLTLKMASFVWSFHDICKYHLKSITLLRLNIVIKITFILWIYEYRDRRQKE